METEQLINSVYIRKAIWNQSHPDYRNRYVLDKLWAEVAEECSSTVKHVQTKWKNLRDYFRKELKKIPKVRSGDAGDIHKKSHWPYFKNLLFLKDQLLPRATESNLPTDDQNSTDSFSATQSEPPVDELEPMMTTESTEETVPSTSANEEPRTILKSRRRKNHVDALVAIEKEKLQYLMNKQLKKAENSPPDEHKLFFDSLLPHVKKIKDAKILEFRSEIQNIVQKYVYEPSSSPRLFQCVFDPIINTNDNLVLQLKKLLTN